MKRISLLSLAALLMPIVASALDFTDSTSRYTDAPFSKAETAGISVLTNMGAVSGNPDGTFAAGRTLNRAEFVKIVVRSIPNLFGDEIDDLDRDCFPDVRTADWFSRDICALKSIDAVEGYPDGKFHPEQSVNYVEAIKILAELYEYELPEPKPNERWAWYTPYVQASEEKEVLLPTNIEYGAFLTRGQMARLAAAFVAESDGLLDEYRDLERGEGSDESSSSSTSSGSTTSSSSSVNSGVSSSSSSSSSTHAVVFPAASSFLVTGETTPVLFDGLFTPKTDAAYIRSVQVDLYKEVVSIDALELIDEKGVVIATLDLATNNNTDHLIWEATTGDIVDYQLPKDKSTRLGIRAKLKAAGDGGASKELLEPRLFSIWVQEPTMSYQVVPTDMHMPSHQTAFGEVTEMRNVLATSMSVPEGQNRTLGSFRIAGRAADGASIALKGLTFEIQQSDVTLTNVRIGGSSPIEQVDCSIESDTQIILSCPTIPDMFGSISTGPITLTVYGNVSLATSATAGSMQIRSIGNGKLGQNGTISWTDGSGIFNWVEPTTPIEQGPFVTVTR